MKVTVEFTDSFQAKIALQAPDYLQFIEDFENFLDRQDPRVLKENLQAKFNELKDLYKI